MKLHVDVDRDPVAPGEEISGTVHVLEGGPSRSLTVTMSLHERSPSYWTTPWSSSGIIFEGELQTGQVVTFKYRLPDDALPSIDGKHASLYWELEVKAEPARAQARRAIRVVARD